MTTLAVGLLTHRVIDFDRADLLEQTVRSIERAFPSASLYALDNGSSDGTRDVLWETCKDVRWVRLCRPSSEPSPPGRGRNILMEYMSLAADITVFDPVRVGSAARTERLHDLPGGAKRMVMRSNGIACTLVAGVPVWSAGQVTGERPGRVLRSGRAGP